MIRRIIFTATTSGAEAKLGELLKQEQEAGRLATQGRPNKPSNIGRLKDYGLTGSEPVE